LLRNIEAQKSGVINVSHGCYKDAKGDFVISFETSVDNIFVPSNFDRVKYGYVVEWRKFTRFYFLISAFLSKNLNSIDELISKFRIHTNASGDFILISNRNFRRLNGFNLNIDSFWHLDSEFVIRATLLGLNHAQFTKSAHVKHVLTTGSGGLDPRYHSKTWEEVKLQITNDLKDKSSFLVLPVRRFFMWSKKSISKRVF
jgi:GT2 family glycosyltransferase